MNKLLTLLLAGVFLFSCGAAWAGSSMLIQSIDTTLDDDPTSINGDQFTGNCRKVGFVIVYDETEVGNSISITISASVSADNSNWIAAYWYDFAGGSTLQSSESMTADGSYIGWFPADMTMPYTRITVTGTNTDNDDLADIDGYTIGLY